MKWRVEKSGGADEGRQPLNIKSHYVTRIVQDVQDAGKESILNPYVFKESILDPYVFRNPILYSNIILGGSCWLHFFFAAGNFSCLHLIARSLKVQGVSWWNIPSFADYFPAGHVVKIGNWLEDTSHASKVGLPSVKVAQLSRLCACGSKLSSRTSTGLFCSSVHLSPIYSYHFLPIKAPPIEFRSYPFVRPLWPRTSRLFNLQDLKKTHRWNDHWRDIKQAQKIWCSIHFVAVWRGWDWIWLNNWGSECCLLPLKEEDIQQGK